MVPDLVEITMPGFRACWSLGAPDTEGRCVSLQLGRVIALHQRLGADVTVAFFPWQARVQVRFRLLDVV